MKTRRRNKTLAAFLIGCAAAWAVARSAPDRRSLTGERCLSLDRILERKRERQRDGDIELDETNA